jgi:hypothetical protein
MKILKKIIDHHYFSEMLMSLIFLVISLLIIIKAYFYGAYISPDSSFYLQAAQSILNGHWFNVYAEAGWNDFYFSHWPIGYPFLIACTSFITGTEVYLASKILTILILAGIFCLLYLRFKNKAWIYALVMVCYPSFLTCFYYTWSEQAFLLGSLWLTFEIIDIVSIDKPKLYHYFNILVACLLMFFVRYVGIQAIGILCLTISILIVTQIITKKSMWIKIISLTLTGLIVFIVDLGYLYLNYTNTGYIGGSYAHVKGELHSLGHIIKSVIDLFIGQISEIAYIFHIYNIGIELVILSISIFIYKVLFRELSLSSFIILATSIFSSLVFLLFRSVTDVDQHYTRHLLVPTILFAFWCIIIFFESKNDIIVKTKQFIKSKKKFAFCIFFLYFFMTPLKAITENTERDLSYSTARNQVLNMLSSIPSKSIIIIAFSDNIPEYYVSFLRPDILTMSLVWGTDITHYPELLHKYENVYLYLNNKYILNNYEQRVMMENTLLKNHAFLRKDNLIKIK